MLAAAALLLLVPWILALPAGDWARRAVVLLVAAAPCALVISLPIAMASGISAAGRAGILIKGGAHLEHLAAVQIVAFDKTGTLTHGRPQVTDIVTPDGAGDRVLALAAALERKSEHPLARAVVAAADERNAQHLEATGFTSLTGSGVEAEVSGTTWILGKPALFRQRAWPTGTLDSEVGRLEDEGKTVVLLGNDQVIVGIIAFQDTLRRDARSTIERLHGMGLRTVMLSGDNAGAARRVAQALGINDVRSGLEPDEKVAAIQELAGSGQVLMVGDGVNDAPALAAATCGVAMGTAGTDAAIEAADIALMADDLSKLVEALRFGRRAKQVSVQNVVFALAVLALLIPLALGGLVSVALAVLVHEGSELLAVANGLRVAGRRNGAVEPGRA